MGMGFNSLSAWPSRGDGIGRVRIWDMGVHWGGIQPNAKQFDWAKLDQIVAQAETIEARISYVFGGTPKWAAKAIEPHYAAWLGEGCNSVPLAVADWNSFVYEVGTRYKGRIDTYELWNEPQNSQFLWPYDQPTLATLASMTKSARHILSEVDPAATVLGASVLPRPSSGGMHKASKYLLALKDEGWPVDALNIHIYPELSQTSVQYFQQYIDQALGAFSELHAPSHLRAPAHLWITEADWGIDPVAGGANLPESRSNELVCGSYDILRAKGIPAEQLIWYAWQATQLHGMDIGPGSAAWKAMQQCA